MDLSKAIRDAERIELQNRLPRRYAKIYVMDLRKGDRIKLRKESAWVGLISEYRWDARGAVYLKFTDGFEWSGPDTAQKWIEIP
jgi:hypothetical protein